MEQITATDLLSIGLKPSKEFGLALKEGVRLATEGTPKAEILEALKKFIKVAPPTIPLRKSKLPIAWAMGTPETQEEIINQDAVRNSLSKLSAVPVVTAIAAMPDACPTGDVITVGGCVVYDNAISPSSHSADACCSMQATFFPPTVGHAEQMEQLLKATRFGQGGRPRSGWVHHAILDEYPTHNPYLKGLEHYAAQHMADQGDGNHFAYLGNMDVTPVMLAALVTAGYRDLATQIENIAVNGKCHVLVTHHGSRGLGAQVYKRGKETAQRMTNEICPGVPEGTEWIPFDTQEGKDYYDALQYVEKWTKANHESIHQRFLNAIGLINDSKKFGEGKEIKCPQCDHGNNPNRSYCWHCRSFLWDSKDKYAELFNAHNFVWKRGHLFYHGKGATPAWKDEQGRPLLGLIPMNMSSPILFVAGGDNKDFLSFAPHGAGRNRSRTATIRSYESKEALDAAVETTTKGIDVRWYSGTPDPSETPIGYKEPQKVIDEIVTHKLAQVLGIITPRGCIMSGEAPEPFWKAEKRAKKAAKDATQK